MNKIESIAALARKTADSTHPRLFFEGLSEFIDRVQEESFKPSDYIERTAFSSDDIRKVEKLIECYITGKNINGPWFNRRRNYKYFHNIAGKLLKNFYSCGNVKKREVCHGFWSLDICNLTLPGDKRENRYITITGYKLIFKKISISEVVSDWEVTLAGEQLFLNEDSLLSAIYLLMYIDSLIIRQGYFSSPVKKFLKETTKS
jgi:hypothetical protein